MSMNHRLEEEMEAAEALAGLARFAAAGRSEGGGSGRKWRNGNGKRRVEVERVEFESSRSCPDLCQQQQHETNGSNVSKQLTDTDIVAFRHPKCATAGEDISEVPVKSEQNSILPDDRNPMCITSYLPLGDGRSKHNNLSETEKEEKRIRRVLANRESARRTIRRRQALCEDLTRRAAELTEENQRLKKGKELALKEYESLETTNKHLKAKIFEEIKPDLHIASPVLKPTVLDASASSTNFPMLPYSRPLGPVFWPSIIHSSTHESCQEDWSDTALVTPSIIMPSLCRSDLAHEQEKLLNMEGTGSPVYIVPCPWFISLLNPGNVCSSATSRGNGRSLSEVCLANQTYGSSSSGTDSRTENHTFDISNEVKVEPPDPLINDLNEAPVESSPLGSGQSNSFPRLTGRSLERGFESKGENGTGLDLNLARIEAVPFGSRARGDFRSPRVNPNENLREDAITAAKARRRRRRRRREIKKLRCVDRQRCQT